jgi:5,10-methenyltetrahydromethanopterin hydrogenase
VTEIGGAATAEAGTGGAATFAVLSAEERQTLRATLAAAHPDTVPELIGGETVGEMVASLEAAKAAYQRTVERARAAIPVAAGGGGRPVGVDVAKLSSLAKISMGLKGQ